MSDSLTLEQRAALDEYCDRFEAAFRSGASIVIEALLAEADSSIRCALLRELLFLEAELLGEQGRRLDSAECLARFPDDAEVVSAAFKAIQRRQRTEPAGPREPRGLQIRCPHCHNSIELAPDAELCSVNCTSCGGSFNFIARDPAARDLRAGVRIKQFELIERVGAGGFGTVWKAVDTELDRVVALKIPRRRHEDEAEAERFLREARFAAQLHHPYIVAVHEAGRDGDVLFIVSEFVDGLTLNDWLQRERPSFREAAEMTSRVAKALHHAHERGVIHRDLKPGNVMVNRLGEPRIMDFGLARRETGELTMTIDGHVFGTPAYMAPEQALGAGHAADRRSDVYSLGVILFELLTGVRPFRGTKEMVIHQAIHADPPNPRKLNGTVPKDLDTIVMRCLEKAPARRFETARELESELARYLCDQPILSRPISRTERAWRWCKRNRLAALLSAVAIGLLGGVALAATIGYVQTSHALAAKNEAAATSDQVSEFLEQLFLTSNPLLANDEYGISIAFRSPGEVNLSARELLDRGAARVEEELSDQPHVRARLLTSMGNAYYGLGEFAKARELFGRALTIEQQRRPPDPLAEANAMHRLAMAVYYADDYAQCETMLRQAHELALRAGVDGQMAATAINQSLAMALIAQDRKLEAQALLQEVIKTRQQLRGLYDVSVIHSLEALAGLQLINDQLDEAEGTIVQILQCAAMNRDRNWQTAADILHKFRSGLHARDVCNHSRAASLLKDTANDVTALLGKRHPIVALINYDYGIALDRAGDNSAAIGVLEDAVRSGAALVASAHPMQIFGRRNLAMAYINAGRCDDALRDLEGLEADVVSVWTTQSWEYAEWLSLMALVHFKSDRPDSGSQWAARALDIAERDGRQGQKRGIFNIILWYDLARALIAADKLPAAGRAIDRGQAAAADNESFAPWAKRFAQLQAQITDAQGPTANAAR